MAIYLYGSSLTKVKLGQSRAHRLDNKQISSDMQTRRLNEP